MSKQYGGKQFEEGFKIIRARQDLIYVDDGEDQLIAHLAKIFPSDQARGFINFCTTFLIV
jgi:hypothetical protein